MVSITSAIFASITIAATTLGLCMHVYNFCKVITPSSNTDITDASAAVLTSRSFFNTTNMVASSFDDEPSPNHSSSHVNTDETTKSLSIHRRVIDQQFTPVHNTNTTTSVALETTKEPSLVAFLPTRRTTLLSSSTNRDSHKEDTRHSFMPTKTSRRPYAYYSENNDTADPDEALLALPSDVYNTNGTTTTHNTSNTDLLSIVRQRIQELHEKLTSKKVSSSLPKTASFASLMWQFRNHPQHDYNHNPTSFSRPEGMHMFVF